MENCMNKNSEIKTAVDYGLGLDTNKTLLHRIKVADRAHRSGDWSQELPTVNVAIPQSVLIACPLVMPAVIQARECKACQHFGGVAQTTWSNETILAWDAKYAITCGKPVARKCSSIVSMIKPGE